MKNIKILSFVLAMCTFLITSCNQEKRTEEVNSTNEVSVNIQPETKSKPEVYLPYETVPVLTAGAGFRGAIVRARLDREHTKKVSVGIAIYARGEKVGQTWVTIPKGELEGEEETRLDGFMGWFEDRIPSTVTLEINSVSGL